MDKQFNHRRDPNLDSPKTPQTPIPVSSTTPQADGSCKASSNPFSIDYILSNSAVVAAAAAAKHQHQALVSAPGAPNMQQQQHQLPVGPQAPHPNYLYFIACMLLQQQQQLQQNQQQNKQLQQLPQPPSAQLHASQPHQQLHQHLHPDGPQQRLHQHHHHHNQQHNQTRAHHNAHHHAHHHQHHHQTHIHQQQQNNQNRLLIANMTNLPGTSMQLQAARNNGAPSLGPVDKLDNLKPAHSYIGLIGMCILSSPEKRMVLNDIYQYILDNYPYYRNRGSGWRNSVRHNLSLNECFQKAGRAANGKGHYWTIHPANMEDFMMGDFRRRRAQRKVRRYNNMDVPSDESEDEPMDESTKPPLPEHFKRSLEMHRRLEMSYQKAAVSAAHQAAALVAVSAAAAAAESPIIID